MLEEEVSHPSISNAKAWRNNLSILSWGDFMMWIPYRLLYAHTWILYLSLPLKLSPKERRKKKKKPGELFKVVLCPRTQRLLLLQSGGKHLPAFHSSWPLFSEERDRELNSFTSLGLWFLPLLFWTVQQYQNTTGDPTPVGLEGPTPNSQLWRERSHSQKENLNLKIWKFTRVSPQREVLLFSIIIFFRLCAPYLLNK